MNYSRVALAGFGAFVVYFALGGLVFAAIPALRDEFLKYPDIYRSQQAMKSVMPIGMVAMLLGMLVLAVLYALVYRGGSGLFQGARFGVLIGLFALCAFVLHNYVNLNIGLTLTLEQAVVYTVQWVVVGIVIGLIYRPLAPR